MDQPHLKRTMGLMGTIAIIVGYVVGASIYILPGELATSSGPWVFISFFLAAIPAVLSCFITAQVVGLFPVAGANFVLVQRALSPFWSFMMIWALLATIVVGMPLLALGFADYLSFFVPGLPLRLTAIVVIILFGAVNYLGSLVTMRLQEILVVLFLVALIVFAGAGLINLDPNLLSPVFPNGFSKVAIAAIPAYFSYTGFIAIAELGGEIENAGPLLTKALKIAFVIILAIYLLVPLALTGTIPWQDLAQQSAPIASAASRFLPPWLAGFIGVSALFAAATSINGVIMAQSRDIFVAAKDGLLHPAFGRISQRFGTPSASILVVTILAILGTALGTSIRDYAVVTVIGFMMYQILVAYALLKVPERLPEEMRNATVVLSPKIRVLISWLLIVLSVLFVLAGISQSLVSGLIYIIFLGMGVFYYRFFVGPDQPH